MNLKDLFRAVYEAPRDDARRLVLADALQTAGDPRGEFIALQMRGSVIARRRSDKLLARHRASFLLALHSVVVAIREERWEKGFLVECAVRFEGTTEGFPELGTVQTLHIHEGPDPTELASSLLTALKSALIFGSDEFTERARAHLATNANKSVRVTHVDADPRFRPGSRD